ncbi:MAG: hypothetical protein ACK5HY_08680 [Parahaliea sp.]
MSRHQQLMQQGLAALRAGDGAAAAAAFERLLHSGSADATTYLALAFARVNLGQAEGAMTAVDQALEREPRNLRALLFKADHLDRLGRRRSAITYYGGALRVAAGLSEVPPDVAQGLQRARVASDGAAKEYQDYLLAALEPRG